jgi:hypothetical protein
VVAAGGTLAEVAAVGLHEDAKPPEAVDALVRVVARLREQTQARPARSAPRAVVAARRARTHAHPLDGIRWGAAVLRLGERWAPRAPAGVAARRRQARKETNTFSGHRRSARYWRSRACRPLHACWAREAAEARVRSVGRERGVARAGALLAPHGGCARGAALARQTRAHLGGAGAAPRPPRRARWGAPAERPRRAAQVPVVFAVDNYQALHSPSGYGQRRTEFSRRALDPGELRVAAALRVLGGPPPAWGVDVAALTWGGSYSRARCQARRGAARAGRGADTGMLSSVVRGHFTCGGGLPQESMCGCRKPCCLGIADWVVLQDTSLGR